MLFLGPFVGALINRYGYRVVATCGGLIAASAILVTSFCEELHSIMIIYGVLGGIGFGMMFLAATVVVGFYFERWRALAISISVCGSSLGIIAFPPIFKILLKGHTWRYKFRVLSVLGFCCAFCGMLYRPLHPIKVVTADAKKQTPKDMETYESFYTDEEFTVLHKIFSKYHNIGYPTTAEVHGPNVALTEHRKLSSESVFMGLSGPSTSMSRSSISTSRTALKSRASTMSKLKPVYEDDEDEKGVCARCCDVCCAYLTCAKCFTTNSRPLYRDDIFYTGSVAVLPEYKRSVTMQPAKREVSYYFSKEEGRSYWVLLIHVFGINV